MRSFHGSFWIIMVRFCPLYNELCQSPTSTAGIKHDLNVRRQQDMVHGENFACCTILHKFECGRSQIWKWTHLK